MNHAAVQGTVITCYEGNVILTSSEPLRAPQPTQKVLSCPRYRYQLCGPLGIYRISSFRDLES